MNIIVHLMFAVTLRNCVKKNLGVALNLRGFLYGNILPDISKKYGLCPHYMKDALTYVVSSKDNLLLDSNDSLYSYRFAKKLGAMIHYSSDFFCHPHTEDYTRSKAYHGYYELMMIARYRKGLRAFRAFLKEHDSHLKPSDLMSFILEHNKTYNSKKASDVNDIRYALFAGIKISESILVQFSASAMNNNPYESMVKAQAV